MKTKTLLIFLWVFALVYWNVDVWTRLLVSKEPVLMVAFLDIGQGDSIFIQAPNGTQMLIDGGKNDAVLDRLEEIMPRGDTSIDVVIATHPDADHIGGLPAVLEAYDVSTIVGNGKEGKDTSIFKKYESSIEHEKEISDAQYISAVQGMRLMLDQEYHIYFDILYPATTSASADSNELSVVGRLVYGETEFMLTGDAGVEVENKLIAWCKKCLESDVLKAGHHGSKTSSGQDFIEAVHPQYAIISAGKDNSYGHPSTEVIDRLEKEGVMILKTTEHGSVVFETDGRELKLR